MESANCCLRRLDSNMSDRLLSRSVRHCPALPTPSQRFSLLTYAAIWLLATAFPACADVKPNVLFGTGAVLQRDMPLPVWGSAQDGEKVTVTLNGRSASTVAVNGRWRVTLPPMQAGGPYTLTMAGANNTVTANDILIGEVWVCSGQSNMEFCANGSSTYAETKATAIDPLFRQFHAGGTFGDVLQTDVKADWYSADPQTIGWFSAVGLFFGRDLRKALNVPVGMIEIAVSGSAAEPWTSAQAMAANPELRHITDRYQAGVAAYRDQLATYKSQQQQYEAAKVQYDLDVAAAKAAGVSAMPFAPTPPAAPQDPTTSGRGPGQLYNGLVAPLMPFAIRGVLWYQGESNTDRALEYRTLLPTLIDSWRRPWPLTRSSGTSPTATRRV